MGGHSRMSWHSSTDTYLPEICWSWMHESPCKNQQQPAVRLGLLKVVQAVQQSTAPGVPNGQEACVRGEAQRVHIMQR